MAEMQVIDHKLYISEISNPDLSFYNWNTNFYDAQSNKHLNNSNDPKQAINTILSFSATYLYVTPFHCRSKPEICRIKPVTCRPAQEHSRHKPVTDCRPRTSCRPEPHCVVTDIP